MEAKRPKETVQQKNKRLRDREVNDIRKVISTPEGRRFYWRLLEIGGIFSDGYISGDNGYGTTYKSGRRSVGVWSLSELMEANPGGFTQMQREHASEAKRDKIEEEKKIEEKDILKTGS